MIGFTYITVKSPSDTDFRQYFSTHVASSLPVRACVRVCVRVCVCVYVRGTTHFYRRQRSWGKVIFSQASVILSTGGRGQVPRQVPPRTRYTPRDQVHPPGPGTPGTRYTPQSSACREIRAPNGRYASYWNAFLFFLLS